MRHLKRLQQLLLARRTQRLSRRAQQAQQRQLLPRFHVQRSLREQEQQERLLLLLHHQVFSDRWKGLTCNRSKGSTKASLAPALLTQVWSCPLPSRGRRAFASAADCPPQSAKLKHKQHRQRQQGHVKSLPQSAVANGHGATRHAICASASSAGAAAATGEGAPPTATTAGDPAASGASAAAHLACPSLPSPPRFGLRLFSCQTAAAGAAAAGAVTMVQSGAATQAGWPLACEEQNDEAQLSLYEQRQQQLLLLLRPYLRPNQERSAISNLLQLDAAQQRQQTLLPGAFRLPSVPCGLALLMPAIVLRGVLRPTAGAPAACGSPEVKSSGVRTSSCVLTRRRQHVELLRAYGLLLPAVTRLFSATGGCNTATRSAAAAADALAEARRHPSLCYTHLLQLHLADAATAAAAAASCAETIASPLTAAVEAAGARSAGEAPSTVKAAEAVANQRPRSPVRGMHSTWQSVGFQGARAFAAFVGGRACRQLVLELQQLPPFRVAVAAVARAAAARQQHDASKGNSSRSAGGPKGYEDVAFVGGLVLQRGLHAYVFAGVEKAAASLLEEMARDCSSSTKTRPACLRGVLACRLLNALVRFLQASRELSKQQQQLTLFASKCAEEMLQLARCTSGCNISEAAASAAEAPLSGVPIGGAEAVDLPRSRQLLLLLLRWFAASMHGPAGADVLPHEGAGLSWRDVADAAREAARLQAFCAEDAHMQAAAPAAAGVAGGGEGDDFGAAFTYGAERGVSNAQLHSAAQEVLLAAAALCAPLVANIPLADLAAILWAAVTAANSSSGQQKGQGQQQPLQRQQQQRLQQQLSPLFHAVSASLLLPQQNAQMLLRMTEERQEQQQKEQHRLQLRNHHPSPSLQLQSSWQLQQDSPLDKSLLTWSLLTWGRLASDFLTSAATFSAAAPAATSPLGAVEWLVLAASFQKQPRLQQMFLQSSGAMALHALAVRADELTRPGAVFAAAAAIPSSAHVSAAQANKHCEQTGPSCTRKAEEAATTQVPQARASAALIALAALPLVRHECAQLFRNMQKAAATNSLRSVSCSHLLSSLLHSAALLRRIELQANPCAHGNSPPRPPDKAVRHEVTMLIVQLLHRLYEVLQQHRLQQQDVRSSCQIVWVMAETGVRHAPLLEHLQLQIHGKLHSLSGKQLASLMCSLFDVGAIQAATLRAAGQQRRELQQDQQPLQQRHHMRRCLVRSFLHEMKLRVLQQQHSPQQHQLSPFHLACCLRVSGAVALRSATAALHREQLMSVGERKEESALAIHAQKVTERLLQMADFLPLVEKQQEQEQQQQQQKHQQLQGMQEGQHPLLQHAQSNGLAQVYQAALTVAALRRWMPLLQACARTAGECVKPPAPAATAAVAAATLPATDDVALPARVWDAARTAFARAASYTTESHVQREVAACLQQQGVSFEAETHTAEGLVVDFRILSLPEKQQEKENLRQQQQHRIQQHEGENHQQGDVRIILEVDGPSHFVAECGDAGEGKLRLLPRGSTLLKEDLLAILGWRVLRLHADAASAAAAKQQLLPLLVDKAGTPSLGGNKKRSSCVRRNRSTGLIRGGSESGPDAGESARRWQRINRNLYSHYRDIYEGV